MATKSGQTAAGDLMGSEKEAHPLFIFLPWIVYKIYPPELKSSPDVAIRAGVVRRRSGRRVERLPLAKLADAPGTRGAALG
jgi:hypothetical protein